MMTMQLEGASEDSDRRDAAADEEHSTEADGFDKLSAFCYIKEKKPDRITRDLRCFDEIVYERTLQRHSAI